MDDDYARLDCPFYTEDHDMGATIPVCRKDGSVCQGSCHDAMARIAELTNIIYRQLGIGIDKDRRK